jgi:hypothetical protein
MAGFLAARRAGAMKDLQVMPFHQTEMRIVDLMMADL